MSTSSQVTGPNEEPITLMDVQKKDLRKKLVQFSTNLLGIEYEYGASWDSYMMIPKTLDCSEMLLGIYQFWGLKMPDGSGAQFEFTQPVAVPQIGDLAFFGRNGRHTRIYHVGMLFSCPEGDYLKGDIIEARGFQPNSSFETGKVILRPVEKWVNYSNFVGWRVHPKLA